jgi:molybdate transport repressor ModE-like protein
MYVVKFMQKHAQLWEADSRHLAALVAIARTRSISKAADELGFGQSAVSQQLAALERIVGHRLVDRGTGPRPVTLTAAGEVLLGHATWILNRLDEARNDLERLETGSTGNVRVGTFQSAGARLLPSVLATFRDRWPDITVSIYNETTDGELAALLRCGSLDVAFLEASQVGPDLRSTELLHDKYVVLVPPDHRLAHRSSLSLIDLDGEDMIDSELGDACTLRSERALLETGVRVNVVFRTNDNPTKQRLVDAGLGCAVLPELTVEPGLANGGVMIALVEEVHRHIVLAWSGDRTPSFAVNQFVAAATAVMEKAPA